MQVSRKNIAILCAILAVALIVTTTSFRSHGQNSQNTRRNENPSPVQEGVMTRKQREHSRLFSPKYAYRKEQKLRDLRGHGDIEVMIGIGDKPRSTSAPPFNVNQF